MKTVRRDWHTLPDGSLMLVLSVEVNGELLRVQHSTEPYGMMMRSSPVPFDYVERDLRRKLMQVVEDRLFGPLR